MNLPIPTELIQVLRNLASQTDQLGAWPQTQLERLASAGAMKWSVPTNLGGTYHDESLLLSQYETIADGCLTTALILTQFHGAIQRISRSENTFLQREILPDMLSGKKLPTLGISHLTTSLQHLAKPAVSAVFKGETVILNGQIPWVTGAAHADGILTGGTSEDGRQVLILLPTDRAGIEIEPHQKLVSLTGSHTAKVKLKNVEIENSLLLAGPVKSVMSLGTINRSGSLTTSVLALGHAGRVHRMLREEARNRSDLEELSLQFSAELISLRNDLYHSAKFQSAAPQGNPLPERYASDKIRKRANSLSLRISQAYLGVTKGAGFISGHPAELAVREALFFLVWSCPQPVVQGVLQELACRGESMM